MPLPLSGARVPRKAALFFVAMCAAAVTTGCSPKPVAQLNGESLSEKEFLKLCETAMDVQPQSRPVGHQVLAQWIQTTLYAQEARRLKIYPTEQELKARIDSMAAQAKMRFGGRTLQDVLGEQHLTMDSFKRQNLYNLIRENVICQGVTVTDAEVKAFFDQQKANLVQPERIRISQITVPSLADAQKTKDDLQSGDFAIVARTRSKDQFQASGGAVPMEFTRKLQPGLPVDQKTLDAAFKLKPGQVSEPIKISNGHFVFVRLEQKFEKVEPKYEDMAESFRSVLRTQKAQQRNAQDVQKRLIEATRSARLTINRPEYKYMENDMKALPVAAPGAAGEMPPPPPG
jgi:foldase protein PrsA